MGVFTFTIIDHTSPVAPARLFKAMCLDNHNIMPKVVPQNFKSIEFVEGDFTSVGCIKQYNFTERFPFKYVKSKVNELDVDKCHIKYTSIESDGFRDHIECVVYEAKSEPLNTGCHFTIVGHYHTKGDIILTEDDIKFNLQDLKKIYEAVEEYLRNNPQICA